MPYLIFTVKLSDLYSVSETSDQKRGVKFIMLSAIPATLYK